MDYNGLDLNLLVCLHALLTERHVTRAAEKLGISQPAMSASLARLRALLGDQLLVRSLRGLALTSRAETLLDRLDEVMRLVSEMMALPSEFEPETSRRTFTLIGTDFVEWMLLPPLMAVLNSEAPGVQIAFNAPDPKLIEPSLATGALDLAIGYLAEPPAASLVRLRLFEEPLVCIAREGHPALAEGMSLESFVAIPHVQALMRDGKMYVDAVDAAVARHGLARRIAIWEPGFLAIPSVVARTDLIGTVPKRVAEEAARGLRLTVHELPVSVPALDFAMYWHERSRDDAGHRWLREKIQSVSEQLRRKASVICDSRLLTSPLR
jgi:DNA-binding transcriptional LysR family regulator